MSKHRKAPLPESMKVRATPGVCRWCGKGIEGAKGRVSRATWHPECVEAFKLIHWPAETRKAVLKRDKAICARCGRDVAKWVRGRLEIWRLDRWLMRQEALRRFGPFGTHWSCADGIAWIRQQEETFESHYGLEGSSHSGGWQHDHIRPLIEANGDLDFWDLRNIQTLCNPCHVAKGKEDNARRKRQKQQQPELL